jgi:hypothetical protein
MRRGTQLTPSVEARSGGLFLVVEASAFLLFVISAFTWVGAMAVNDSAGIAGGLLFSLAFAAVIALAIVASRNVKLFATPEVIGVVGPLGGVRTCPRAEFAELRFVRHSWSSLHGVVFWRLPTLHFRRRDGVDAFSTSAYLYRKDGLQDLAQYLGVPLDLSRPNFERA